jgi:hypothetical protein
MASTYEKIATTTLGSAQTSVAFSSISGSYTDLVLIVSGSINASDLPTFQVGNGSASTSGYSQTVLRGNGSNAASYRFTNQSQFWGGDSGNTANSQMNFIVHLQNYSNTNVYKTALDRFNNSTGEASTTVHLWQNTSAINYIVFKTLSNNSYNSGSTFTLYGIKSA